MPTYPPPNIDTPNNEWLGELANIAKIAKIDAKKSLQNIQKTASQKLYPNSDNYMTTPKKINKMVFKYHEMPPFDCFIDRNNNILTNPEDIAKEIQIQ